MNVLIVKLGATGDVVRTTTLLRRLSRSVTWITAAKNAVLLDGLSDNLRHFSWEARARALDIPYDLVINLEDTLEVAMFLKKVGPAEIFGAYSDSCGRQEADRLKLLNRQTYQELIFGGLGFDFAGETYLLPEPIETGLSGDVAIAADSGPIWPMKRWAYYGELKRQLEDKGLSVNMLPERSSLLEHLSDVRNHCCLVGGDSLPMHLALGTGTRCVTLFTCTSPWEIYDYGVQTKLVSPLLEEFFYKRGYDKRATTAINVDQVFDAVMAQLADAKPRAKVLTAQ